jgi:PTH1 family peptidyl-tRNA hydrolase
VRFDVKLIVGLGNPGRQYEGTRHNVGFVVVDEIARRRRVDLSRFDRDFEGLVGESDIGGERTWLLKPLTYMNLSGRSVAAFVRFYKLATGDVLIVGDDLDLLPGQIRLRASGSGGGQKGLTDVLAKLGTQDVPRLRIGIGKVHKDATVDHVLSRFAPDEREPMAEAIAAAADAAECWAAEGITTAMNRFNKKPEKNSQE